MKKKRRLYHYNLQEMKLPGTPVLLKFLLLLSCWMQYAALPAQNQKGSRENLKQEVTELNKTLLGDQEKQLELAGFYAENFAKSQPPDDTISLYLADLNKLIDSNQKQHINYPIRLREDCRALIRKDLLELTQQGRSAGYSSQKITAINDAYLKEVFYAYKNKYTPNSRYTARTHYANKIPEFGRADYLKAIKTIFTTIVTLRVNSITEEVRVVVYSMRDNKFVANSTGKTEFVQPLESGAYIVELSKPGFQKKLRKVVLGKYPKTVTIQETLDH